MQHLGLAVSDLESAIQTYERAFGVEVHRHGVQPAEKIDVATFRVGDVEIELMEPTESESPVGRFLARRGEGVHHVAYQVDDATVALRQAREAGLETIDQEPRAGLRGTRVAFIHPRSVNGVLTELVEEGGRGGDG